MNKNVLLASCIVVACNWVKAGDIVDELQQGREKFCNRTPNAFHYYMDDPAKVGGDRNIIKRFQPAEAYLIYSAGDDGTFQDVTMTAYSSENILDAIQVLFGADMNSWEVGPLSKNDSDTKQGVVTDLGVTISPFKKYTIHFAKEAIPAGSKYLKIVFRGQEQWNPILGQLEAKVD